MLAVAIVFAFLLTPTYAFAVSQRTTEVRQIQRLRTSTWHWQKVMGVGRTPTSHSESRAASTAYRHWVLGLWRKRATRVWHRVVRVPHKAQWLCIHRGEGNWRANTGNSYYGGLQMDLSFQRSYGGYLFHSKGTANRWSPYEQMWVAERAYTSGRGFYPWPNTARACGLI
jgi:Transglycosylase-like domain